jgi:hypothetical protein
VASDDHWRSQSFPGEDASHTYKTERANTYIRKKPKGEEKYKEPPGKEMSLIGKGNERAKETHAEQSQGESDRKDKALSMQIDEVNHVKRTGYYSEDIKKISEQKDHLFRNWGACVDTIFWKNRVKRGKEKQLMKNRV